MSEATVKLTREEAANIEIGNTDMSRGMAWTLVIVFIAVCVTVPAVQLLCEGGSPGCLRIFAAPERAVGIFQASDESMPRRLMASNRSLLRDMHAYEDQLEDDSFLTKALVPPVQHFMARRLRAGNEKAYIGRDKWLFYRPGLDYLTGTGFLDPQRLTQIAASGNEWTLARQPDPRRAILEFRDHLAERDIALVLMPIPVKPGVHPEQFSRLYDEPGIDGTPLASPLHNASFDVFVEELRGAGVLVCDLDDILNRQTANDPLYLSSDTHWRPETMELAAQHLGAFLQQHASLPELPAAGYKRQTDTVSNLGDVAQMMQLPEDQQVADEQTVEIQQVLNSDDNFWRPRQLADVLLLGDSFSNIYSLESMGWGASAGLAEQLSFVLQRPLDVIVRNDEGSHATRAALSRDLARGKDRLAGKRVVVWQFVERELSVGDWKLIDMKLGTPTPANFITPEEGQSMLVTGIVEAVSPAPRPGSVPYKDHVVTVHLRDLEIDEAANSSDEFQGGEALVYIWSMRDNTWTDAARLRERQKITLRLKSWYDVADRYESINRSELDNEELQFEDPCWGELLSSDP